MWYVHIVLDLFFLGLEINHALTKLEYFFFNNLMKPYYSFENLQSRSVNFVLVLGDLLNIVVF
jgi:hypothetical protein